MAWLCLSVYVSRGHLTRSRSESVLVNQATRGPRFPPAPDCSVSRTCNAHQWSYRPDWSDRKRRRRTMQRYRSGIRPRNTPVSFDTTNVPSPASNRFSTARRRFLN